MKTNTEATPRPWRAGLDTLGTAVALTIRADKRTICHVYNNGDIPESEANATLIVRAVNSHDELVTACKRALWSLEGCNCECSEQQQDEDGNTIPAHICLPCQLKAALRNARGEG